MNDLIQQLERASAGSRELDSEVRLEFITKELSSGRDGAEIRKEFGHWDFTHPDANVPHYTTSLDAALPGENIEQVAVHDCVEGEPLGVVWEAWHIDPKTRRRTMGAGNTEILARRIAALKAIEAEKTNDG